MPCMKEIFLIIMNVNIESFEVGKIKILMNFLFFVPITSVLSPATRNFDVLSLGF